MKVLLVVPPHTEWPFLNKEDNYLLPQWLPSLAAVLRENDIEVKAIDCMPLKMGWKSLEKEIEKEGPDVVGTGSSEALYSDEALKLIHLTKKINPEITTVLGGAHFSHFVEETLENHPVDFIVIGEGEYSFLELVKESEKKDPDFKRVNSLAYRKNNRVTITDPRPLIKDLDELPMPAYDLLPMKEYGKSKYLFHPGGTTIHHSRGCIGNCTFCICWKQMSERKKENNIVKYFPKWRTKSVKKTVDELEFLYKKYNKRGFVFTDDTWNIDPKWSERFAEEIKKRKIDINWFAFMRADFIVRDEKLGVLKKIVDSGLSHVCVGIERSFNEDLKLLNKNYSTGNAKECFKILKEKYPQVFRQGTFIVGLRNETKESMMEQLKFAKELDLDFPAFHPLTPIPGTELWERALKEELMEIKDFRAFDWMTPVMSSKYLTRDEIEELIIKMNNTYVTPLRILKGVLSPYKYKRKMYKWFLMVGLRLVANIALYKMNINRHGENEEPGFIKMVKPAWYND